MVVINLIKDVTSLVIMKTVRDWKEKAGKLVVRYHFNGLFL